MKSLLIFPFILQAAFGGVFNRLAATDSSANPAVWQPELKAPFQIILNNIVDVNAELIPHVDIYDVDLWETSKASIERLKEKGKKVICYFSAGTSEAWRQDYSQFEDADKGSCMDNWPGEKWLDIRRDHVFEIMQTRIKMAWEKGCDAIDPDNVGKLSMSPFNQNLLTFLRWLCKRTG
jgi:hypothetical protein